MKYIVHFTFMFAVLFSLPVMAMDAQGILGLWLSHKRDVAVRIERCEGKLCGRIAWLAPQEPLYSVTGAPLCGASILNGFSAQTSKETIWANGKIYKADDDKHYSAILTLSDIDTLELRAYVGVPALGKTKVFKRVDVAAYPPCNIPEGSYAQTKFQNIAPAAGVYNH